jgi:hypothetical protein
MADPTKLANFREARDSIQNVRQLAAEIDRCLGRFQIYVESDAICDAFGKMDALIGEARVLEARLRRCGDIEVSEETARSG